jgi:hypothetical protein
MLSEHTKVPNENAKGVELFKIIKKMIKIHQKSVDQLYNLGACSLVLNEHMCSLYVRCSA